MLPGTRQTIQTVFCFQPRQRKTDHISNAVQILERVKGVDSVVRLGQTV